MEFLSCIRETNIQILLLLFSKTTEIKLIFFHFIKYSETDGFNVKEKKIKSGIRNWTRLIML